jgi:UDP-N-acetylglucosamine--N-acetylmuramyl-(pentapeptide) pyrophosphoryl-undecaprenol N-acetylglucosamine transferase
MLLQRDVTPEVLLEHLRGLLGDSNRRAEMALRARALAKPGALERIAGMVVGLAGR